jgi:hypothetical protein
MTPISVPGQISGDRIIDDLLNRIREKLERSNDLRQVDSYTGYSAEGEIRLQLKAVDMVAVAAQVKVGAIDPALPVQRIALNDDVAGVADESLEKPIDPAGVAETAVRPRDAVTGRFLK